MKRLLTLAFLLALCSAARAALTKDIEFAKVDGVSLLLDTFVPDGPGPFAGVIMVHGGGWNSGDKSGGRGRGLMAPMDDPLSRAGFVWFEINYRLAPKYPYPACIDDVETAIRWVKAHAAEYHLDPSRIALAGESAGGHLVDLAAARADPSTRVAAVVSFYGVPDLVAQAKASAATNTVGRIFGLSHLDDSATPLLLSASAISHLKPGLPPFLLVHGDKDEKVPYQEDLDFRARLLALGVPCDLITIHGGGHGMITWEKIAPEYKDQVVAWLKKTLPPHPWRTRLHKLLGI
jgi:alpha-L-fucosidase 2